MVTKPEMVRLHHLLLAAAFFCLLCDTSGIEIDVSDGGYGFVLVAIHPDVDVNETIVQNLKAMLRSASLLLHRATRGRVFFKRVAIQFPKTWPLRSGARRAPYCCFSKSDVRVETPKPDMKPDQFSAKLRRGCGGRGDFIRVSPSALMELHKLDALEAAAHRFVQEWARFRYGVFYEYGRLGDDQYPLTYCSIPDRGRIKLNSCSAKITHHLRKGCRIEGCFVKAPCDIDIYLPKYAHVESSIMFSPHFKKIIHFCNSEEKSHEHNPLAPNMQNMLCDHAPTWDIIRQHKDFMRLPAPNMLKHIEVHFREIQQKPGDITAPVVLVLDTSGSMKEYQRIETVKKAVDGFLVCLHDDLIRLAIVTFSTNATLLHPMAAVNKGTVEGFRDAAKTMHAKGSTCIGCGLKLALEVLASFSDPERGGIIVLLTDGQENRAPYIDEVFPELLAAKADVNTMAMGDEAEDKLEKLAKQTKGSTYFFPDYKGTSRAYIEVAVSQAHEFTHHWSELTTSNEAVKLTPQVAEVKVNAAMSHRGTPNKLGNLGVAEQLELIAPANSECFQQPENDLSILMQMAFGDSINRAMDDSSRLINVMSTTKRFVSTLEDAFILDGDLGNNTNVIVSRITSGNSSFTASLVDPTGQVCQNCREDGNGVRKIVTIPSPAMAGTWTVRVVSSSKEQVTVHILVTSQAKNVAHEPIVALCEMSEEVLDQPEEAVVFVDVRKGPKVVLDAIVTAVVISQEDLRCIVQLHDDGNYPDIFKNDGTYTGYYTKFTGRGRYSVIAYISGGTKTRHAYRRQGFPFEESITVVDSPQEGWKSFIGEKIPTSTFKAAPKNYAWSDTLVLDEEPTPPFQRVTGGVSFKVVGDLQEPDVPPGRIWDLQVTGGHVEIDRTPVVTLTWTWPGAHMTQGKAAAVELRGGTNDSELLSDFESQEVLSDVIKGNLEPLPARSKHVVTLSLPRRWETAPRSDDGFYMTAYLAARVTNTDGLKSKRSNVVPVMFEIANVTAQLPPAATTTTPARTKPAVDPATTPPAEPEDEAKEDYLVSFMCIVLATVAGLILLAMLIRLMLISRSKDLAQDDTTTTKTCTPNMSSWQSVWPPWAK